MPERKNHLQSIGKQIRRISGSIVRALFLFATMEFAIRSYWAQEILVLLLLMAIPLVAILALAVVFVLLQEGTRRSFVIEKIRVLHFSGLRPHSVDPQESIVNLHLRK